MPPIAKNANDLQSRIQAGNGHMVELVIEAEAPSRASSRRPEARPAPAPLVLQSRQMFGGQREVLIAHGEDVYRLRLTAADRLILTK